ncbi:hypothetical protein BT69DRAFT_566111 [Atractiella rhizophila]|nr:hypothetical protein BT69DRAFT_566111 [Atractiella rhizophila]
MEDLLNQVPVNSRPRKILCLGLGTLEGLTGRKGRTQLGLLVHLQNKFMISSTDVELFDPVFSDEEKAFLSSFGFTVRAEQPSLNFDVPTLAYLPHAPRWLFEKILETNMAQSASNVVFLGNDMSHYYISEISNDVKAVIPNIFKHAPAFSSLPLPHAPQAVGQDVFNDLSVQFIASEQCLSDTPSSTPQASMPT